MFVTNYRYEKKLYPLCFIFCAYLNFSYKGTRQYKNTFLTPADK
ncbi:hypothetical protein BACEGG_01408 [Bacteroides eggerthii DSM 20697]|nr:hypothetical protein BACEGG_01408 [Bacteroides eggerthii DSM 20697]